jgi:hypothetical protein
MLDKNEYKKHSRERLLKIVKKKIQTAMIGALDAIERHLKDYPEIAEKVYNDMRKDILDKGNAQIRNIEAEFEQYEINWLRYTMVLPVRPLGPNGGNNATE